MTQALVHRYRPRGTARAIFADRGDEILVSGPAGTGKSRACLEKLHALAMKYDDAKFLLVRKTLASLGSTALETWRRHVIAEALQTGEVWYYGGSNEEPPQYRYANGSKVVIGGLDKPVRIMSSEYDFAYVQESIELSPEDWEAITTRLRNGVMPYQQLLADANPAEPTHWLKQRCERGDCTMYNSLHEENPRLFDIAAEQEDGTTRYVVTNEGRAYIAKLDRLTGVRYLRLRKGLWVAAEGVIYEQWNPAVHLVDDFEVPLHWKRFWAVDFGYVNPFVCQMWAEDPDTGHLYLYREIYHTGKTVDEHCVDIMAVVSVPDEAFTFRPTPLNPKPAAWQGRVWIEPKPQAVVCDHDAEGRATFKNETNLSTKAADKQVLLGIDQVQVRLKEARLHIMRGAPVKRDQALIDSMRPTCTADEIPSYVWKIRNAPVQLGGGKVIHDEPEKKDDHGCDAMRYLVVYKDPLRRPSMRVA